MVLTPIKTSKGLEINKIEGFCQKDAESSNLINYKKGSLIKCERDTILQVKTGVVELSRINFDKDKAILGWAFPDMPFGGGLIDTKYSLDIKKYQAKAISEVSLKIWQISDLKSNHFLYQQIQNGIVAHLRQTKALLSIALTKRVEPRLRQLLRLLEKEIGVKILPGTRLNVRFTHDNLSAAICTSRSTITKFLREFRQNGEILIDSEWHIIITPQFGK